MFSHKLWLALVAGLICLLLCLGAQAKNPVVFRIDLPVQSVAESLTDLSEQSDTLLLFPYVEASGIEAKAVHGWYSVSQALDLLLTGTSFRGGLSERGVLTITAERQVDINHKKKPTEKPKMQKKKNLLASIISMIVAGGSQVAIAQDNTGQADQLEEVVVTGIRHSLKTSSDIKRDSYAIVDSLQAEDVGKFPDSNVAEALQRISGVSIDRTNGEGKGVTVRGFGPQFNTVLVNGRRLASDAQGREFNFDLISAELIGGADVHKTTQAFMPEGGIGSTINLRTQRPLELDGPKFVISSKAVYEELSEKTSPNAFALVSQKFMDDTVGILLSASYQKRDSLRDYSESGSWKPYQVDADRLSDFFADGQGNGAGEYYLPGKNTNTRDWQERTRTGLSGVFQYSPSDDVTLTLDALYSDFEVSSTGLEAAYFINPGRISNAEVDSNNVVNRLDWAGKPEFVKLSFNRPAEVKAFGANLEWQINESLSSNFDLSYSEAKNGNSGNDVYFVVQGPESTLRIDNTLGTDVPQASAPSVTATGLPFDRSSTDSWTSWWTNRQGTTYTDEVIEAKADFDWSLDFGPLQAIQFGFSKAEQTKAKIAKSSPQGFFYGSVPVSLPSSLFQPYDASDFLNSSNANFDTNWVDFNPEELISYLESDVALTARDIANGDPVGTAKADFLPGGYDAVYKNKDSFSVEEKITAVYTNARFESEVADMPLLLNFGLRYVKTEVEASGAQVYLLDLLSQGNEDQYNSVLGEVAPVTSTKDYSHVLPSLNLKMDLSENLIARFSYSKSLTRPELSLLAPRISFPDTIRPSGVNAKAGNPELEPYESKNLDLSLEWYYSDTGSLSLGLFKKDIDGFIVSGAQREGFTIANASNIDDQNISGNTVTFNINRPRNLEKTSVKGLEVAFQHTFDYLPGLLSNMGLIANATFVDTSDEFDVNSFNNILALPGLGDSQNLVVFYEDEQLELRIAYNNREKFFSRFSGGSAGEPVFTNQYSQIDIRAAYNISDSLQVFAEGINVGDEVVTQHGRYENQFVRYEDAGARYSLGVRFNY